MKNLSLFYFTESYPYGMKQIWKTYEIIVLSKYFKKIIVVPLLGNDKTKSHIYEFEKLDNIEILSPIFSDRSEIYHPLSKRNILTVLLSPSFIFNLIKNSPKSVFFKARLKNSLIYYYQGMKIIKSHYWDHFYKHAHDKKILYFHWGLGQSQVIPFLNFHSKDIIIVRYHGYDLYNERNNGFIPFRKLQLKKLNLAVTVSDHGKKYLSNLYPLFSKKIISSRLGILPSKKTNKYSESTVLRIISCSRIIPLKRIELIVKALALLDFPYSWTHIGDGPDMSKIKKLCIKLGVDRYSNFKGWLDYSKIKKCYTDTPFDLFVNVSTSEGIPISIMEALSFGIPIIATDVGGTAEIIDNDYGILLMNDIKPLDLAKELKKYYSLNEKDKIKRRNAALEGFNKYCNSQNNSLNFINQIKNAAENS